MTFFARFIFALTLSFVVGCSAGEVNSESVQAWLEGKPGDSFSLEIADTIKEREKGLMYRQSLPKDSGMIFVFPAEEEHVFWMKNTPLSLDMIFLDKKLKVVGILRKVPPMTTKARTVGKPSMYVIELLAGGADQFGIKEGDSVKLSSPLSSSS